MVNIRGERGFPEECIFLADREGGYFALDGSLLTQYQGLFHFLSDEWELYKTIENIRPFGTKSSSVIVLQDGFFERHTEHVTERFWFSLKNLVYEIHGDKEVSLELDFRRIHDYNDKGRIYVISQEKDELIIEYKKYEDDSLKELNESKFLVVKGIAGFNLANEWIKKEYVYDKVRGARNEFYVYNACTITLEDTRLTFGFGDTKKEAKKNANKRTEIEIKNLILDTEIAEAALSNLIVSFKYNGKKTSGIFAGYPWFYQFWGRDEAISLIGLIKNKKHEHVKEILMRMINSLDNNGCLGNRWPESKLGSADSTGWLFKRTHQFLQELEKENKLKKVFSKKELRKIYEKISKYAKYSESLMKNGLIMNKPLETWMDTTDREGRDLREGARIEIQALHLAAYSLGEDLTQILKKENADFTMLKEKLKQKVKETFISDEMIVDGFVGEEQDLTIRPNIFLAYYAYPHLFSKEEWVYAFNKIIETCWLEWGGFSSINKNHYLFRAEHTGMTNESYHRGDSWFFVNNIAATCMMHIDRKYYYEYIHKIRIASVTEMTHHGFLGQCAELSSAKELCSRGALAQAWSAATLIEMLHEWHRET
ncbi:MAG: amylo-alpha-1,6-glucosidase [Candidatus Nanoarchaeia archaeon]